MAGFKKSGTDLDSLFEPIGSFAKRADVNFKISGTDISNNYASASDGTPYGTTSFLANGTDIGTLFAAIGTTGTPGSLWVWGNNQNGSLGNNATLNRSSPVQTVSSGTNWKYFTGGSQHSAAIKTDGTLWVWGSNAYGELGITTLAPSTNRSSPVQTVASGTNWKSAAGAYSGTRAIKTDGTLWAWGYNSDGQLGDNTIANKSSPVQTVAGGTNWKQISCGQNFSAGIKTDGTLWTWGNNAYGQLGDNTNIKKSSPVQTVSGGTNWASVSCGLYHVAAIKTDGTLWTWGNNLNGQSGTNISPLYDARISSPVQTVAGGTNWKLVSCNYYHVAAIKTDGTLWTWGSNLFGELGDNTSIRKSSPVQTVAGGTNWKSSAAGFQSVITIKTNNTLWTWGRNNSGNLGDNTTTRRSSPVQTVSGGTNWILVGSGFYHVGAIKP